MAPPQPLKNLSLMASFLDKTLFLDNITGNIPAKNLNTSDKIIAYLVQAITTYM